jgi:hypothetical protein
MTNALVNQGLKGRKGLKGRSGRVRRVGQIGQIGRMGEYSSFCNTTVRVLEGVNAKMSSVYGPLVSEQGCERLEVFMRFFSSSFAKLPGCMPENLFSPNSPT